MKSFQSKFCLRGYFSNSIDTNIHNIIRSSFVNKTSRIKISEIINDTDIYKSVDTIRLMLKNENP